MAEEKEVQEIEWIDFESVMTRLKLTRPELYRQVKDGKIKADKHEQKLRFDKVVVDEFDEKRKQEDGQVLDAIRELERRLEERFPMPEAEPVSEAEPSAKESETPVSEAESLEPKEEEGRPSDEDGALPLAENDEAPESPPDVTQKVKDLVAKLLQVGIREKVTDLYLDPLSSGDRLLFRYGDVLLDLGKTEACLSGPMRTSLRDLAKLTADGDTPKRRGIAEITEGEHVHQVLIEVAPTRLGDHVHVHFWHIDDVAGLTALGYTQAQAERVVNQLAGDSGFVLVARGIGAADDLHHVMLGRAVSQGNLVVSCESGTFPKSEHLVQVSVDVNTENGLANALETALGLEPDVLMVDMVSKPEDLRALFSILSMGGVVVAGIRALDFADALRLLGAADIPLDQVQKWITFGVERVMLRHLCPNCKTQRKMTEEEQNAWEVSDPKDVCAPEGCERCQNGYLDRHSVFGLRCARPGFEHLDMSTVVKAKLLAGDISITDARDALARFQEEFEGDS